MPAEIEISGFNDFIERCNKAPEEILKGVDQAVQFAGQTWVNGAVRDAPKDIGDLAHSISTYRVSPGVWEVGAFSSHAAYMEWGTKSLVSVPAELADYASQFAGAGTGGGVAAKTLIYAWCQRKGIDRKLWYLIYRKVMTQGVRPHPYFFQQRPIVEKQLDGDLRQILEIQ